MMSKLFAVLALAVAPLIMPAAADSFPVRPIKIIVGFTPGSSIDSASRVFGKRLSEVLGQPVVVENVPGASGVIAVKSVQRAPADGHTILTTGMSQAVINPIMMKDLPYDPIRDFVPVSGLTRAMFAITVPGNSPVRSLAELVTAAKASPTPLNAGSYSPGYQLYTEWLGDLAKVKFNIVPYKGASAVVTDLLGGRLDFAIADISSVSTLAKEGRLRLLAVTGENRAKSFPDVPTMNESGFAEYVGYATLAFQVRADTPQGVRDVLSGAMSKILAEPEARAFADNENLELVVERPEALRERQRRELENLQSVAKKAGIKPL